ncbi:hypothetical protein ZWY2020_000752 [Hordeum vulgare]|nr:hypothetical protein ZWY2020_000752 [Hordeum vulgare]
MSQDLAGDNTEIREQLREITGWFPSIEMMRNHACGLIKVMREDEKLLLPRPSAPPSAAILWAVRRCSASPTRRSKKVVDVPPSRMTAQAGSYLPCLEDGEGDRCCPQAGRPPSARQIIPPFHCNNNKKKREPKKSVGVLAPERLKNPRTTGIMRGRCMLIDYNI